VIPRLDVAVIGSGFGGLTAAALSARTGLCTAVFERHTRPGGCAGDFALEGFTFPAGATVVTGLEPGGILCQVLAKLDKTVTSRQLDPSIVFHVGGKQVPYVASHREWSCLFRSAFPGAPGGYLRLWDWVERTGDAVYRIGAGLPSLPIQRLADVRRTFRAVHPGAARSSAALAQ
jgi:phytoene dehydrogenase-like protein